MFSFIDWFFIFMYLFFAFTAGILLSPKAGKSLVSYFVADRKLPWWWLGTSMVATTFAADTPLVITGFIAADGISANWFWWSWAIGYMAMTVFFAGKWRRMEVLTDVEFVELRYGGKPAIILRMVKAFYLSILVNSIVLGWVFKAMSKITGPFLDWKDLLGADRFSIIQNVWPSFLIFDSLNNTITVLILFLVVVVYSSMGGIQGVILTDLVQFALGMGGAILFAVYAVSSQGGISGLLSKMEELYPDKHKSILSFWPDFQEASLSINVFLIFISVQWWAQYYSDGSGYLAQRIHTAKNPKEAEKGSLWFNIANFMVRTWPWILTALVTLVVFPLHDPTKYFSEGWIVGGDREMGYPILMKLILPNGILGIVFASLMAAFMSTADTHINWGASYLVNDFYLRFVHPKADDKTLVKASRIAVVTMSIIAILVATQIQSIANAWKFLLAFASGMGLPQILRWIWWRTNAWTELSGMITALILSMILYPSYPNVRSEYLLFWVAIGSVAVSILVTFLTPPVPQNTLDDFIKRVDPIGFWKGEDNKKRLEDFYKKIFLWLLGTVALFFGMFSLGYFFLLQSWQGFFCLFGFVFLGILYWKKEFGRI
ncbi:sodium:solute symporter family protein [Leptospira interrogans]|uniref:Sodium/glucose cotransport protein n=5 Tax=Leptospira interrogans TaxID=173 RepID=Q72NC6_LEPIC|nr:sodium:solute symporter family protein [Leptospira interrogans]AAS71461.1 sodium/glucose cotransport protein [Leptospira interrogans serovar Copenhageni str. Fiocruz L1-130]ARB95583.1 sodium transporter [Leptospira interrogans serovar Copenhageni]EKP23465.1 transporter, SSS family [Leptospira interrogans serovar Icterohaemorrhagiae str. Verdun LP]EKP77992.1 transporter, SSS family [Leptospira interrogans str. HAI1594]EMO16749.1 transporter, SSS family [Leptospira interrogans serovar Copenha